METDLNNANPLSSAIGFIEHKHTEMNYSGMCNKCCIVPDFLLLLTLSFSPSLPISFYLLLSYFFFSLSPTSLSLSQSPSCLPPFTLFLHILGDNNRLDDNKSV